LERRNLNDKDFNRLSKMINGSDEDYKLVLSIIDSCHIAQSFKQILCLIPKRWDLTYLMSTRLMTSPRLYEYIYDLVGGVDNIPIECSLDFMMELWALHSEQHNLPASARDIKEICGEYKPNSMGTYIMDIKDAFKKGVADSAKRKLIKYKN